MCTGVDRFRWCRRVFEGGWGCNSTAGARGVGGVLTGARICTGPSSSASSAGPRATGVRLGHHVTPEQGLRIAGASSGQPAALDIHRRSAKSVASH